MVEGEGAGLARVASDGAIHSWIVEPSSLWLQMSLFAIVMAEIDFDCK